MPQKIQTDVVLTAKTKGLDRAIRETLGLNKAAYAGLKKQAAATKEVTKELHKFEAQLGPLAKKQAKLSKEILKVEQGSKQYKDLQKELRGVTKEYNDVSRAMRAVARENNEALRAEKTLSRARKEALREQRADQRAARGSFTQGLAQGAGIPSDYLKRGPGMGRQIAGQFIGAGARRASQFGWGMSGGALTGGLQGIQGALQVIPGGGILSGQLGAAAGFSGQALGYQRQQVEAMPYMRIGRGQRTAQNQLAAFQKQISTKNQQVPYLGNWSKAKYQMGEGGQYTGRLIRKATGEVIPQEQEGRYMIEAQAHTKSTVPIPFGARAPGETEAQRLSRVSSRTSQLKQLKQAAAQEQAASPEARFRRMGRRFGFTPQEALQQAAQYQRAGGGVLTGAPGQMQNVRTAMAAQRQFGIGAETSGALLRGTRRGGLLGAETGAKALADALGGAVALNLEGSEINEYLEQIASGINQFQTTGIPFNQDALNSISRVFAEGLAPTRAARVAGGLAQYMQGIGTRGPQGGFDLMAMQQLGGYQGGQGNGKSLMDTFITLEELGGKLKEGGAGADIGEKMKSFLQNIMSMAGGDKEQQRLFLARQLNKRTGMSMKEANIFGKRLQGEQLTEKETEFIKKPKAMGAGMTPETLIANASKRISAFGSGLQKQADVAAKQLRVGREMLPIMQNLSKSAATTNQAFMNLSGKTLNNVTEKLTELANEVERLTRGEFSIMNFAKKAIGMGG